MKLASTKLAAAAIALAISSPALAGGAKYAVSPHSIEFAAETARDPSLLVRNGQKLTPTVSSFPKAPSGGPDVNGITFAAETAANPKLLASLGARFTKSVSKFGEYVPESDGGDKPEIR
jgi:hypothetical protein